MRTGNLDGIIYGNEWQTVYDSGELVSAATSITISNLDGNLDKEYRLICRFINNYNGTATYSLRMNGDTGSNYGFQQLYGDGTTAGATRGTGTSMRLRSNGYALNAVGMVDTVIYSKSGFVRTVLTNNVDNISGTTIGAIGSFGQSWNNTSDNIISLTIFEESGFANGIGVGSRIILMRRADRDISTIGKVGKFNTYGKIKGCFQKIYENTLSSATDTITISNLDGNSDVLYCLKIRAIGTGVNAPDNPFVQLNGDSGSNYGQQYLGAGNTTVSVVRFVYSSLGGASCPDTNAISLSEFLIYAKSGYVRTAIMNGAIINFSSVLAYGIEMRGGSWNNTSDNITSIVFKTWQAGKNYGIGTVIELWAYRP